MIFGTTQGSFFRFAVVGSMIVLCNFALLLVVEIAKHVVLNKLGGSMDCDIEYEVHINHTHKRKRKRIDACHSLLFHQQVMNRFSKPMNEINTYTHMDAHT
jgi:hypothetical protein